MSVTIRMTPQELKDAAKFLQARKDQIVNEVSQLKSKIDEVTASWEGQAQGTFVTSFYDDMLPLLRDTFPEVVEGIAAQLNGAAEAIEQADSEVAKAFGG